MTDKKSYDALIKTLKAINVTVTELKPVAKTRTGILSIDAIFQGGLPEGRFIELYGEQNSGKSTTAMILARQYMAQGKRVILLDAENTFDRVYAAKFGMDVDMVGEDGLPLFTVMRADTAEQWFDGLREILASRLYALVIVDTLAACVPKVEYESSIDKGTMGVFPRLFSRLARAIGPVMYDNPTTVLILNQQRLDIGNIGPYGAPKIAPGGNAKNHLASIQIQTLRPIDYRDGGTITGLGIRYKIVKSKVFSFDIKEIHELRIAIDGDIQEVNFGYELFREAGRLGILTDKDGNPWKNRVAFFEGERLEDGEDKLIAWFGTESDTRDRIEQRIYAALEQGQLHGIPEPSPDDSEDPQPVPLWADDGRGE